MAQRPIQNSGAVPATNNPPIIAPAAPNATTLKSLSDSKLISFAIGQQKKSRFQKQREEKELKKKIDEDEAAKVYESFVESFQNPNPDNIKTFVRAGEKVPATPFGVQSNSSAAPSVNKPTTPGVPKRNNAFAQDDDEDENEQARKEELQRKKNKEMDKFLSELKVRSPIIITVF
jgi:U2-associated protein SR140